MKLEQRINISGKVKASQRQYVIELAEEDGQGSWESRCSFFVPLSCHVRSGNRRQSRLCGDVLVGRNLLDVTMGGRLREVLETGRYADQRVRCSAKQRSVKWLIQLASVSL